MPKATPTLPLACLLLLASWGTAFGADDLIERMRELVRQGKAETAYELGQDQLREREGNPRFDFYYGVAAIDSGHVNEGIFALQRVLFNHPDNDRARLELARGYYRLGEDARARREFETVLRHDPPKKVEANIRKFLDAIRLREARYETTATAYAEVGAGYDDNVNGGPADANFFSPLLGQGTLSDEATQTGDAFSTVAVGGQVNHPVRPGVSVYGGLSGDWKNHQSEGAFDTASYNGRAGVRWGRGKNRYDLGVVAQQYQVGHETYRNLTGVNARWTARERGGRISLAVAYANLDYPDQEPRDSDQFTMTVSAMQGFGGTFRPVWFGSAFGGREEADDEDFDHLASRNFVGLRTGAQLALQRDVSLRLTVLGQTNNYQGTNLLFLERREDDYYSASAELTWLLDRHWSVKGDVSAARNDSNISIYQYDRARGSVAVRYEY